jgi:NADP-dependent 3-hydroxy acid dehydrogenase YdfG
MTRLLDSKNTIVYGGGSIGGGVARTFAREGARVFLAGRTREPLEAVAADIEAAGGSAEVAVLDVLDGAAVDEVTTFDATLFPAFGLPPVHPGPQRP